MSRNSKKKRLLRKSQERKFIKRSKKRKLVAKSKNSQEKIKLDKKILALQESDNYGVIDDDVIAMIKSRGTIDDDVIAIIKSRLENSDLLQLEVDKIWKRNLIITAKNPGLTQFKDGCERLGFKFIDVESKEIDTIIFNQGMKYIGLQNESFKWYDVITSIDPKFAKGRFNFERTCNGKVIDNKNNSMIIRKFYESYTSKEVDNNAESVLLGDLERLQANLTIDDSPPEELKTYE